MGKCPTCGQAPNDNWPGPGDFDPMDDWPDDYDYGPPPGTWQTKEGEWVSYRELENSHLLNIVAMLERKFKPDGLHAIVFGLKGLKAEVARRGLV